MWLRQRGQENMSINFCKENKMVSSKDKIAYVTLLVCNDQFKTHVNLLHVYDTKEGQINIQTDTLTL